MIRARWRKLGLAAACAGAIAIVASVRQGPQASPSAQSAQPPMMTDAADKPLGRLDIPDVTLTNQFGAPVRLQELVRGKTVAMSFIFTHCTTICPPIGIQFSRLQKQLGDAAGKDVQLVSISIDPENDTPNVLRAWGERFGAGPGWSLLTGTPEDIDRVLKAMTVYTAAKEEHAPIVLIGNDSSGEWIRTHALSSPNGLWTTLDRIRTATPSSPSHDNTGARKYFTDVSLIDQDKKQLRLYSDLLQNRTVIAHAFFTSCTGSCPVLMKALTLAQERVGDRLGKDVVFLSITMDPENDTPEKLKEYAGRIGARDGWHFLTGEPKTLQDVRRRIGEMAQQPADHSAILVAGNDRTGLWKKAFGLAPTNEVVDVLMSVVNDAGGIR